MRNVKDDELLIKETGLDAGCAYVVIASNTQLFVLAEIIFDPEDGCYHADLQKLSAYCNDSKSFTLNDLGFNKIIPRQY